jgi:hypothetical protein
VPGETASHLRGKRDRDVAAYVAQTVPPEVREYVW